MQRSALPPMRQVKRGYFVRLGRRAELLDSARADGKRASKRESAISCEEPISYVRTERIPSASLLVEQCWWPSRACARKTPLAPGKAFWESTGDG